MAVAEHARVRGLPRRVAAQERVDDARAELRPQVQREVRHPHAVGELAGEPDGVGRAAGRRGVVLGVAPELQRHRDRVRTHEQRGDRGVHAAAHRDQHALLVQRHAGLARGRPQRAVQRVRRPARPRAACPARARRAPRRSTATLTRAASRIDSPSTSVTAAEPAAVSAPQPDGVKARRDHPRALDDHGDPDQVPADRASRGAVMAPGKHCAAPIGRGEMLFKSLAVHRPLESRTGARCEQSVRPSLSKRRSSLIAASLSKTSQTFCRRQRAGLVPSIARSIGADARRPSRCTHCCLKAALLGRRGGAGDLVAVGA